MARTSSFNKSKGLIKTFFNISKQKVFTLQDLSLILIVDGPSWGLPASTSIDHFAEQLIESKILSANKFRFKSTVPDKLRFWTTKADIYDVALGLMQRTYLSHLTALSLHGIISKNPTTIFVTSEQSPKQQNTVTSELLQEDVDEAFTKQQRLPNASCEYHGKTITILNGKFTNQTGVIELAGRTVTSIERTLIDITVRPAYAGGVQEVLQSYIAAREQVDVATMIAMLVELNYVYPYFQSVGFYLEKAGYETKVIQDLQNREKYIDFYLAHAIDEMAYSPTWRLYYPSRLSARGA